MVREEDVKQLKDVLRFFVHRTSEAREDDPKHREEVSRISQTSSSDILTQICFNLNLVDRRRIFNIFHISDPVASLVFGERNMLVTN